MWPITLSGRLPIVDLVGRYPANYLMGRERTLYRIAPLTSVPCSTVVLCGISTCFQVLSPCTGQLVHALLTRPPLELIRASTPQSPLDLHVLGTPPAFVLSQDQTLIFDLYLLSTFALCVFLVRLGIDFAFLRSPLTRLARLPCLFSYVSFSRFVRRQFVSLADSLVIIPRFSISVNTFLKVF